MSAPAGPGARGANVGDRVMLAVYDGTVKAIPDFSITPPPRITLPATTSSPTDGPTFNVSRNDAFTGSVELTLVVVHLSADVMDISVP